MPCGRIGNLERCLGRRMVCSTINPRLAESGVSPLLNSFEKGGVVPYGRASQRIKKHE